MKKTIAVLMSSAALAVSINVASAGTQHPLATTHGNFAPVHRVIHKSKFMTLYDQQGTDAQASTVSQNFETSFDIYDSQAADDFIVPVGQNWRVHEIDVTGQYFDNDAGPAMSENVFFYKDLRGLPGKLTHIYSGLVGKDDLGSFVILIPGAGAKIVPGHYWVSVQVNMDLDPTGEWGWENQTTQVLNPAAWQNPNNGFGTGCTKWTAEQKCFGSAGGHPIADGTGDQMFALKGKTKGG